MAPTGTWFAADGNVANRVRQQQFPIVGKGAGGSWVHVEEVAIAPVAAAEKGNPGIIANDRLSLLQSWFVEIVIMSALLIAAALLWTRFSRIGFWLLLSFLLGAILFGIYNISLSKLRSFGSELRRLSSESSFTRNRLLTGRGVRLHRLKPLTRA